MKKATIIITILATMLATFVLFAIIGVLATRVIQTEQSVTQRTITDKDLWQEFEGGFMNECLIGQDWAPYCDCVYTEIQTRYTIATVPQLLSDDNALDNIADTCINLLY